MFSETDGKIAFDRHQKLIDNEQKRRELLIENTEILMELKDSKLYKAILGDEKAEWRGYLGQIEIMYSQNDIYTMMRIYKYFVEKKGIALKEILDIPKSRLYDIVNLGGLILVDEWLDKARTLNNLDWKDEIRIVKGKKPSEECEHKFRQYEICSECGVRHKKDEHETEKSISN